MQCPLERLRARKIEIEPTNKNKKNNTFIKIEKINDRTMYHTKITKDFYVFGANRKQKNKFLICMRDIFKSEKINAFNLFSIKGNDRFLGMYYGYKDLEKPIIINYKNDTLGTNQSIKMFKVCYVEFRFKQGSVFCYIKCMKNLLKKEKKNQKYCEILFNHLIDLEKKVYEFYDKTLPKGGIVVKWIEKNQK
ncbi:DUF226 domain-containing protein [Borrelia hispanica]|uniref:DUF226 domain-containing protein n=1 Tax=Borrelia hispanica TaxID=40835 RepID=UPI000464059C|nr:DUF226 domain-containing protein [Borrelia hispanica]